MSSQALEYVEVDISYCALTYGVPPCQASLVSSPPTGTAKCFNSLATCQDTANFTPTTVTLRFAIDTAYLPRDIEALPYIRKIDFTPAIVSLGVDLGARAVLKVELEDRPHPDVGAGYDKYATERGYNPYTRGTYWPRFRARQPYLRGQALRWRKGFVGDALEDMETRYFFVDSFDLNANGTFTIIAKDTLKFLDGDRVQAPVMSNGFLLADITNVATSATLSPSGIGAEYPGSGHVNIGGNEVCAFTRAADVLTLTRAQLGSTASAHNAQDRVQVVLRYAVMDPADILYDLLVTYGGIPSGYIDITAWRDEIANNLGTVYTLVVAEPTPVNKLVSELIEVAALAMWDDNINQKIRMQVLRAIVTEADRYNEDNVIIDTFGIEEQPDKRISQVWVYFAQIDPTGRRDDTDNYRSTAIVIDDEMEAAYGSSSIKKLFARAIPALGRTIAERMAELQLARYRQPPRKLEFQVMRNTGVAPVLGGGYRFDWWSLQDASGAREDVPIQITRLNAPEGAYKIEAEEALFDAPAVDLADRQVIVDVNTNNINLKTSHDALFPAIQSGQAVTCTISAGVIVGSSSTASPAFDVGTWPAGVTVTVVILGRIEGAGGSGGAGGANGGGTGGTGTAGGTALYVRQAITLVSEAGGIWGGGGGGGGGAGSAFGGGGLGGGGAGQVAGGTSATDTVGGVGTAGSGGGQGGQGGNPGLAGSGGSNHGGFFGGSAGAAGNAIDGNAFVTTSGGAGDRRGGII